MKHILIDLVDRYQGKFAFEETKTGVPDSKEKVKRYVEWVMKAIEEELLQGGTVRLTGIGSIIPKYVNEKETTVPTGDGKRIVIPGMIKIYFRQTKLMKRKYKQRLEAGKLDNLYRKRKRERSS